ncbi:MAG: ABC transporter substrate-binding protein [Spirochaetaceae bacterium]|jgi:ABC-type nitrate/sulfonate/bicarbonate transport system substrate-binding protein|nr:ABC transporter substrate-binding protein [Spirochaetaceae bacterium]
MNMKMRKLTRTLFCLTAAIALANTGCERKHAPAPAKAAASNGAKMENARVALDWTPNTNHTGLYAALENGYFSEAGFIVTIIQPPEDGALLLTAAGKAEYAFDFQESLGPAIARKTDALPVVAVAAIINHNTSGIMSLAASGIKRPRDLAGKRFASWGTPLVTAIIRDIVEEDGGNFGAVRMIPNNATDAISALQTDIDAIWIYYAWDGMKARLSNIDINYIDIGAVNPVFDFYTPVLVTNADYAAANGDSVKRFMAALSKGYRYAIDNPQQAADALLRHAPELDRDLVYKSQEYLAERYQAEAPRWGEIDEGRWGAFYRWMYEKGLLETDIGAAGFTNKFLP